MSLFLAWFAVMFPLVFSLGPANIAFAATGSQVGLKRSLPFLIGIDSVFIVQTIIVGFGLGQIVQTYPSIMIVMQLLGAVYLIYLAYTFMVAGKSDANMETKRLGFKDGLIVQALNSKGWIMVFLMFSLFATQAQTDFAGCGIAILIVWLAVLNISLHMVWIVFGELLAKISNSPTYRKRLDYIYALCLVGVALWLIIDNPLWKVLSI